MELAERVIVITGATGGVGRVASRAFADLGARLALVGSNQSRLDSLVAGLPADPARITAWRADLSRADEARAAAQSINEHFGAIHAVLHLVGGWTGGKPIVDSDPADLASMLDQHVWTTWHMLQAFVPHLTAAGWGRLLIVSSPAAGAPPAGSSVYAAAKAAEEALLLTAARELDGSGVTANILQVRAVDAEHQRAAAPAPSNADWTTPEELVAAMRFLCSDEAGLVNGARLPFLGRAAGTA
ncbi:MAG TPA: SDR family NAD(P)-dependent oxidoreductase [Herpetosiphonaceae bacterium]|nr:SDR family NAD(P)-dependent oxidoreductase [Herpetosiphonaceae bacterium]